MKILDYNICLDSIKSFSESCQPRRIGKLPHLAFTWAVCGLGNCTLVPRIVKNGHADGAFNYLAPL